MRESSAGARAEKAEAERLSLPVFVIGSARGRFGRLKEWIENEQS